MDSEGKRGGEWEQKEMEVKRIEHLPFCFCIGKKFIKGQLKERRKKLQKTTRASSNKLLTKKDYINKSNLLQLSFKVQLII